MKRTAITTAALTSAFLLAACGGSEEEDGPVGSTEINPGADQGGDASDDEEGTPSESLSEETAESADQAYQQAQEDSEDLAQEDDFSEFIAGDDDYTEPEEFEQYLEDRTVVMERAAEIMTGFQAGDWNKDVAIVRANHLLIDGAQQPGIPETPQTGDPSWDSAMECNASAEVRTDVVPEHDHDHSEEHSHTPHREVIAEYRWSEGDDGCEVTQPDHYYVYYMAMNDDAMIIDFSREQVSYNEEDPGLFDD